MTAPKVRSRRTTDSRPCQINMRSVYLGYDTLSCTVVDDHSASTSRANSQSPAVHAEPTVLYQLTQRWHGGLKRAAARVCLGELDTREGFYADTAV